jgi:hypothetical protein
LKGNQDSLLTEKIRGLFLQCTQHEGTSSPNQFCFIICVIEFVTGVVYMDSSAAVFYVFPVTLLCRLVTALSFV